LSDKVTIIHGKVEEITLPVDKVRSIKFYCLRGACLDGWHCGGSSSKVDETTLPVNMAAACTVGGGGGGMS
jgi:hypothetical protein